MSQVICLDSSDEETKNGSCSPARKKKKINPVITEQHPDLISTEKFPPELSECTLIPIKRKPNLQTVNIDSDDECTVNSSKKETEKILKYIQTKLELKIKPIIDLSNSSEIKDMQLNKLENKDLSSNSSQANNEKHVFLQARNDLNRDLKLNSANSGSMELISLSDDDEKNKLSNPISYNNEESKTHGNKEECEVVSLDGTDSEDERLKSTGNLETTLSEPPVPENTYGNNNKGSGIVSLAGIDSKNDQLKLANNLTQSQSITKEKLPSNETIAVKDNYKVSETETVSLDGTDSEDEELKLADEPAQSISPNNNKTTSLKNHDKVSETVSLDGTDSEDEELKLGDELTQEESMNKKIELIALHTIKETASDEVSKTLSLDGTESEDVKLKLVNEPDQTKSSTKEKDLNILHNYSEVTSVKNNDRVSGTVTLGNSDSKNEDLKSANDPAQRESPNKDIKLNTLHNNNKNKSNGEVSETVSLDGTDSEDEELKLANEQAQRESLNKDIKLITLHNTTETSSAKNNEVSETVSLDGTDTEDEELKLANNKLIQKENSKKEIKSNTLYNNDETISVKNNNKVSETVNLNSCEADILATASTKHKLEISPSPNSKKRIKLNPVLQKDKTICHKNTDEVSETVSLDGTDSEDERLTSLMGDQISKIIPSPKKTIKLEQVPNTTQDKNKVFETISLDGTDSEDERLNSLVSGHNSDSSRVMNDSDSESSQSKENHSKNGQIEEKICESELENSKPSTSKEKSDKSEAKSLLKRFLKLVKHQIRGSQFEEGLTKKFQTLEKYYHKCGENVKHKSFLDLIKESITKTEDGSAPTAVIAFHKVFEHLKLLSGTATVEVEEAYVPVLKKLEKTIKLLTKKIKQLEEAEIDFEDDEDSAYIQADKYQKRLNKVYAKYCKYIKKNPYNGRLTYDKINFCNSSYNEINLAINRKYKNSLKFPSYYEMERYVAKVAKKENLKLSESDIKYESGRCFKELGKILQKRRKAELYDCHVDFIENSEDPASKDRHLENTLKKNFIEGELKIEKLCQKYSAKQEHGEDKVSSAASESSDCSEDEQPT